MNIKKYRKLSFVGIGIFVVGLSLAATNNNLYFHLFGLTIAVIGWLIFSNYHTKIAIYQLKKITSEYVNNFKPKAER